MALHVNDTEARSAWQVLAVPKIKYATPSLEQNRFAVFQSYDYAPPNPSEEHHEIAHLAFGHGWLALCECHRPSTG